MRSKRILIGSIKSRHCCLQRRFSGNENLQQKQNWIAKSTNLEENAGKIRQFLSSEQPCELEVACELPVNIARAEKYTRKICDCRQYWRPFNSSLEWKDR